MEYSSPTIEEYTNFLAEGKHFTLARYGDGEWSSILGDTGVNCDGVRYTKSLKELLTETLVNPGSYQYGILQIAVRGAIGKRVKAFIRNNSIEVKWIDATFLVAANRNGKLNPFIEQLRKKRVLYVGPRHLRTVSDNVFPIQQYIEIPSTMALENFARIRDDILEARSKQDFDVIGISAGPAAKVIIYYLAKILRDTPVTVIDFGSLFDGYVGVRSRKYMRSEEWDEIARINTGAEIIRQVTT